MVALVENTDYFIDDSGPGGMGTKQLLVRTLDTVDATDTLTVDLSTYGINDDGFIGVLGFKHTTDNSVMVQEQPTTAVSGGVLTITVPAGSDNDPRYYIVWGIAKPNA